MSDFSCETCGKWILAGEHAVLRGVPALVFPVPGKTMKLRFKSSKAPLQLTLSGPYGKPLELLFWGVVERALGKCSKSRDDLKGNIELENWIPIGAGLGASAALCVAITKWFFYLGWIASEQMYEFARSLEDLFHGESSGVDIAVSLESKGIKFQRGGGREHINLAWRPKWYLSYCGKIGVTSECVEKVKKLYDKNPTAQEELDGKMFKAVEMAEKALQNENSKSSFSDLCQSVQIASECFQSWGLTQGELGEHLQFLKKAGAKAAKPTGSGGGGYALSLWENDPPEEIKEDLIELS